MYFLGSDINSTKRQFYLFNIFLNIGYLYVTAVVHDASKLASSCLGADYGMVVNTELSSITLTLPRCPIVQLAY